MTLESGDQLGRYKIINLLGRGGMGEVYLAEDIKLERTVALKVLPEEVAHNQQRLNRFAREARAASALNHPNVAHIYEIEVSDEHCFIAMEYIKGKTLHQYLSNTRMKLHEALDIAVQATRAIAAAHAAGIVHRDIKTENIMISQDGYVKVLDFGLAKLIEHSPDSLDPAALTVTSAHTDPGSVLGTVGYMSPEQARGYVLDARTDLWSLGVVIYEMVSGTMPFVGKSATDVLSSILNEEPPPLARFVREVPEALEWIVTKALTKDLESRYQKATEMLADLQRLKNRLGVEAEIERSSTPEFRLSRNSWMSSSRAELGTASRAPLTGASIADSTQRMSNAEYIVTGIKRHKTGTLVALSLLAAAIVTGAVLLLRKRENNAPNVQTTAPSQRPLTRVTFGSGLQLGVTWSADSRWIAYSSDSGGNFDIWVQSLGGKPMPITHSPAHDWQPDWSPDGTNIVFRSERDGGGLYLVPASGGNERKLTSFGYRPRWSPDGSKILFLGPSQRLYNLPKIYFFSLDDLQPHELSASAGKIEEGVKWGAVAWHPDGQRISFLNVDGVFWTMPINGGALVRSEISPEVEKRLKEADVALGSFRWAPAGNALYFEGRSRGILNIWKIKVDPATLRWIDGPERLTTGTGQDTDIALSPDGNKLAFTTTTQNTRTWLLPFDAAAGRVMQEGQPVTAPEMDAWFSDLSPDGKKLVFLAHRYGMDNQELLEKSLVDGSEKVLAVDNYYRYYPRWSPDSQHLAYSRFRLVTPKTPSDDNPPHGATKAGHIVMLDTRSGEEQMLTSQDQSLDYMYDWSPDGKSVLASSNRQSPQRWQICLFPISAAPHAETEMRVIASDPENSLWTPRFSHDGQWVCYVSQKPVGANTSVLYVIPISGGTPVRITDENGWCDWPRWSPEGKTIYFVSAYGSSFLNVWGIRFDPVQGRAVGEPFRVTNFESPGRMISTQIAQMEMAISKNKLALPITTVSGNIWMLGNVDR